MNTITVVLFYAMIMVNVAMLILLLMFANDLYLDFGSITNRAEKQILKIDLICVCVVIFVLIIPIIVLLRDLFIYTNII
jgi:hypothetical protein